jgi:hypothetical protein
VGGRRGESGVGKRVQCGYFCRVLDLLDSVHCSSCARAAPQGPRLPAMSCFPALPCPALVPCLALSYKECSHHRSHHRPCTIACSIPLLAAQGHTHSNERFRPHDFFAADLISQQVCSKVCSFEVSIRTSVRLCVF